MNEKRHLSLTGAGFFFMPQKFAACADYFAAETVGLRRVWIF